MGIYDQKVLEFKLLKETIPICVNEESTVTSRYLKLLKRMSGYRGTVLFQEQFNLVEYEQEVTECYQDILKFPCINILVEINCKSACDYNKQGDIVHIIRPQKDLFYRLLHAECQLNNAFIARRITPEATKLSALMRAHCDEKLASEFEAQVLSDLCVLMKELQNYFEPPFYKTKPNQIKSEIAQRLLEKIQIHAAQYKVNIVGFNEEIFQASLIDLIANVYQALCMADHEHMDFLFFSWQTQFMAPGKLGMHLDCHIAKFKAHLDAYTLSKDPYFAKLCRLNKVEPASEVTLSK